MTSTEQTKAILRDRTFWKSSVVNAYFLPSSTTDNSDAMEKFWVFSDELLLLGWRRLMQFFHEKMRPFVLNARIKSEFLSIVCSCTRWKLPLQTLIEEELNLFLGKSEFYHPENLSLRVRYGKLQLTIFCWKLLYRRKFRNWGFGGRGHEDDFGEASWKTEKWKTFSILLHLMSLQISVTLNKILCSKVFSAYFKRKGTVAYRTEIAIQPVSSEFS